MIEGGILKNIDKFFEFLLKLIELIRPKFFNKITWLVVSAGLALMSTPLLDRLVTLVLKYSLDFNVTGENDVAWGFALVVLGLLYHAANTGLFELVGRKDGVERETRMGDHDKAIFVKANELMTGDFLSGFLNWVADNHAYEKEGRHRLHHFLRYLASDDNQFLSEGLQSATQELLRAGARFLDFTAMKFFVYPNHQADEIRTFCMAPSLNIDREGTGDPQQMAKYDALTDELDDVIKELKEAYRSFRQQIKAELFI